MNRRLFGIAGLFLAVALVVPPIMIHTQSDADLINILNQGGEDATQVQQAIQAINEGNLVLFATVGIVDAISIILFAVFLWMALKS